MGPSAVPRGLSDAHGAQENQWGAPAAEQSTPSHPAHALRPAAYPCSSSAMWTQDRLVDLLKAEGRVHSPEGAVHAWGAVQCGAVVGARVQRRSRVGH